MDHLPSVLPRAAALLRPFRGGAGAVVCHGGSDPAHLAGGGPGGGSSSGGGAITSPPASIGTGSGPDQAACNWSPVARDRSFSRKRRAFKRSLNASDGVGGSSARTSAKLRTMTSR